MQDHNKRELDKIQSENTNTNRCYDLTSFICFNFSTYRYAGRNANERTDTVRYLANIPYLYCHLYFGNMHAIEAFARKNIITHSLISHPMPPLGGGVANGAKISVNICFCLL